jgi:hypothetical protein
MSDSLDPLEVQLRRLKPTLPAADFTQRVEKAMAAAPAPIPARTPAWRQVLERWIGPSFSPAWSFAAIAAAVALIGTAIFFAGSDRPPNAAGLAAPRVQPIDPAATNPAAGPAPTAAAPARFARAASVPEAVYDDGFVRDESGAVTQRVRYQFTDTLEWRDEKTGAEVVVSFPRVEVYSSTVRAF